VFQRIRGPLLTPRLTLRAFARSDWPDFERMYRDRRAWTYIPEVFWRAGARVELTQTRRTSREGRTCWYVVTERPSGAFVGQVGLYNVDLMQRTAELAYVIARPKWGKGYATEAAHRMCQLAFHRLRLRRLDAIVGEGNNASVAILRKLGFRAEGTSRKLAWFSGGWRDAHRFGLLASEYPSHEAGR
jgi:[ribosomal protein S5]-alanine N-acetyltransferase